MRDRAPTTLLASFTTAFVATLCIAPAAHAAVTISSKATQNMTCSSGVCTPTAAKAVLNVGDLTTMLASGNVIVNTGSGSLARQVQDIVVSASFNWASAHALTLDAYRSITFAQPVADNGSGAVTLKTNDGGSGGTLLFGTTGSLSFLGTSNSLTIDGRAFTLENSIATLASAIAANAGGAYALAANYDASADGTYRHTPIQTTVTGTVEGLGNTISNLSILLEKRAPDSGAGLFNIVGSGGTIESLKLAAVSIEDTRTQNGGGGGLVSVSSGTLSDDHVSGAITDVHTSVAGLTEDNSGTIVYSSADMRVKGKYAGGLVVGTGGNGSVISLSHADGAVSGEVVAGGFIAASDVGTISQSYATGRVSGGAGAYVGGFVGLSQDTNVITDSYATGAVSGGANAIVGGFAGENDSTIENSYSTGAVTGGAGSFVGGFSGGWNADSVFTDCYWDTSTSGTDEGTGGGNLSGITGLTTAQFQSGLPSGFDPTIWSETSKIINGLPYLLANPPPKK